jgi:hypothetical protein
MSTDDGVVDTQPTWVCGASWRCSASGVNRRRDCGSARCSSDSSRAMTVFNTDMVSSLSDGVSDAGAEGSPGTAVEDAPCSVGAITRKCEQGRCRVKIAKKIACEYSV